MAQDLSNHRPRPDTPDGAVFFWGSIHVEAYPPRNRHNWQARPSCYCSHCSCICRHHHRGPHCHQHGRSTVRRGPDIRSPQATQYRGWYQLKAWQQARRAQLSREPLCSRCKTLGYVVLATVVNHIIPHKGDWFLFISSTNHESTCKPCHDSHIQSYERTGIIKGSTPEGRPRDPSHPWNRP